jgi:alpha,alpha-trehalase
MKRNSAFQAVIFDLDGVVTRTAVIHARAWKLVFDQYLRLREKRDSEPFREFTHRGDYLTYVDGKPRYKGVNSFLKSRKINIPYGLPEDLPDKESICGIGNRKNLKFLQLLKKQRPQVFRSTIRLIKNLQKSGVRIGVASSSANCRQILESSGIEDLFQTRVDGVVSRQLKLKGKPESDIFVTAAHNLGAEAASSVVVEDASSGVAAGRNGGFGLVLGVARGDNRRELLANGADIVVRDLAEINIAAMKKWFARRPKPLPRQAFLGKKRLILFLDYDGTITPIVQRPELAILSAEMKGLLRKLAKKHTLAVISGRERQEVERLVGVKGIIYAGNHGMDIAGPSCSMVHPRAGEFIPLMARIAGQLKKEFQDIPGVLLQAKKFSVSVHYRLAAQRRLSKIQTKVTQLTRKNRKLRLMSGNKVWEIMPAIDWDKGRALRWIMQTLKAKWSRNSLVYIGDDTTDEDAFRILRTRGTGVLVCAKPRPSAADFYLPSVAAVKRLLEKW